jgi:hypothetical protein
MKYMALATLWAFIVLAASVVYGEKPKPQSSAHTQSSADAKEEPSGPTGPSVVVVNQNATQREEENNPKKSPHYLTRLFSPENLPNIALVIVGIVGTIVALRSLLAIEQQVTIMGEHRTSFEQLAMAARDNARAAALNAEAVKNAERAWIVVNPKPKKGAPGKFIFGAFNAGRTPAIIIDGHCLCETHSADFVPPEELNHPMDQPKRDLIVRKDSFVVREVDPESCLNQADSEGVGTNPQIVFVYGKLRYWDAFTDPNTSDARPCETWWCFQYDPTDKTFDSCENGYARNS